MLIRCFDPPALNSGLGLAATFKSGIMFNSGAWQLQVPQQFTPKVSFKIDDLLHHNSSFLFCCWFSGVTTPHYENKQDAHRTTPCLMMMKSEEWLSANVSIVGWEFIYDAFFFHFLHFQRLQKVISISSSTKRGDLFLKLQWIFLQWLKIVKSIKKRWCLHCRCHNT